MSTAIEANHEERVTFENWRDDGCHVFVNHKHVLTLNTPESCLGGSNPEDCFTDEWISADEYCDSLCAVLQTLGASAAVVAAVAQERINYQVLSFELPSRDREAEFQAIFCMAV